MMVDTTRADCTLCQRLVGMSASRRLLRMNIRPLWADCPLPHPRSMPAARYLLGRESSQI